MISSQGPDFGSDSDRSLDKGQRKRRSGRCRQGCCLQPDPSGCWLLDSKRLTNPWNRRFVSVGWKRHGSLAGGKRSNRTTEIPQHFGSLLWKCLWPWAQKLLWPDLWGSSPSERCYFANHLAESAVVGNLDLDVFYLGQLTGTLFKMFGPKKTLIWSHSACGRRLFPKVDSS